MRALVAVLVSATLAGAPLSTAALGAEDPELAKGIALVDDGDTSATYTFQAVQRVLFP